MMRTMGYKGYVSRSYPYAVYFSALPDGLLPKQGTFFLFGSFCACMFFFAYFFVPETKGMSLEKMDELFGITEDVMKTIDDPERQPHEIHEKK